MSAPKHAALLLAAGASRRLGTPKQLLVIEGEPLVRRASRALLTTRPSSLHVVVGARADDVFAAVSNLGVQRVDCSDWTAGLSASLRAGIAALGDDVDGVLVALCDQPAMDAAHLRRLIDAFHAQRDRAVASAYAGVLGVPAMLPRAWFNEISRLQGDSGARELLRARSREVCAITAPALANDIDEPADHQRL